MEEKNKGLNINIEHYTGEKPIEVVYRLGDAAQAQQPLATKARKRSVFPALSPLRMNGFPSE